jgi:hypothetical protein
MPAGKTPMESPAVTHIGLTLLIVIENDRSETLLRLSVARITKLNTIEASAEFTVPEINPELFMISPFGSCPPTIE